jgi:hypothetical protein
MRAASWDEHSSFVCDERMGSETEHLGGNIGGFLYLSLLVSLVWELGCFWTGVIMIWSLMAYDWDVGHEGSVWRGFSIRTHLSM